MIKLFNFRPILFMALCFAGGILFAAITSLGVWAFIIPILFILLLTIGYALLSKEYKMLYYGLLLSLVFIFGFVYFYHIVTNSQNIAEENRTYVVTGTVKESYSYGEDAYMLTVGDLTLDGKEIGTYTARVITKTEGIKKHDKIKFEANFDNLEISLDNLDYIQYKTCLISSKYVKVKLIGNNKSVLNEVANLIEETLLNFVPENQSGVLIALVLGDTSYMDRTLLSEYRMAGVAHIFAVSGLHIGFFCVIFSFLFDKMGLKRLYNAILVALIGLFYVGVCDFSVSALRALIMYFIHKIASSFGRKYDFLNSIFLSMLLVLTVFPESLFSYGFWLSYSAVISIALFARQFTEMLNKLPKFIAPKLGVALAVFIGTLPVIILMLGEISLLTVILNVILIPIVSVIYYFTLTGTVIAMIFPRVNVFLIIANALVYLINDIMLSIGFERFLLKFSASEILLIPYTLNIIFLSEKVNLSERARKYMYYFLPFSLLLLI